MHPLTDALPSYMDALAIRQACGEIEAGLRADIGFLRETLNQLADGEFYSEDGAMLIARAALEATK